MNENFAKGNPQAINANGRGSILSRQNFRLGQARSRFGFSEAAALFGAALAVIAALYFWTNLSRVMLFWAAFIVTRPLGATVGDFLDKPVASGGLEFSRPLATAVLAGAIVALVALVPQRAGEQKQV